MNNKKIRAIVREVLNEQHNLDNNFWRWFGDSKTTDSTGSPLIYYHGTNSNFNSFDAKHFNKNEPSGDYIGAGFYFTPVKTTALKYGEFAVKSVYLKIENPLIVNNYGNFKQLMTDIFGFDENYPAIPKYFILKKESPLTIYETIKGLGYDGLIDNLYNQCAVFEANQIKSVDNDGTWDEGDDNIYS